MVSLPDTEPSPDWVTDWTGFELSLLSRGRSPSTVANRRNSVMAMARLATADGLGPAAVTKPWMQRFLISQQRGRHGNGYAVFFEGCKMFWSWYADEHGCASPVDGIGRPRHVETEVPVLTREQLQAVMKACSGKSLQELRDRALLMVLTDSGMRRAEAAQLDVGDVDLRLRTLVVRHGKGDKPRVTTMGDAAAQAVWRYVRARGGPKDGPLFASRAGGGRLTASGISQAIAVIGERAGVPGLRPHLFRHSWAHHSKAAGMQEGDLMTLGGWTSTSMLARYGRSMAQARAIEAGRAHSVSAGLGRGSGQ